jgi:dTDP-4-amino-4,6-dideoxygalactose transaminase
LAKDEIYPRRYFYPSLQDLPYVKKTRSANATFVSKHVVCLPMFYQLESHYIDKICATLIDSLL